MALLIDPREARRLFNQQYPTPPLAQWVPVTALKCLARKNVDHHSAEMYLLEIDGFGNARHYMITKKCQLKANGTSTPKADELAAWNTHFAK